MHFWSCRSLCPMRVGFDLGELCPDERLELVEGLSVGTFVLPGQAAESGGELLQLARLDVGLDVGHRP